MKVTAAGKGDQAAIPSTAPSIAAPSRPRAASGTNQAWPSVRQAHTWVPMPAASSAAGAHRAARRGRPAAATTASPVIPTYR